MKVKVKIQIQNNCPSMHYPQLVNEHALKASTINVSILKQHPLSPNPLPRPIKKFPQTTSTASPSHLTPGDSARSSTNLSSEDYQHLGRQRYSSSQQTDLLKLRECSTNHRSVATSHHNSLNSSGQKHDFSSCLQAPPIYPMFHHQYNSHHFGKALTSCRGPQKNTTNLVQISQFHIDHPKECNFKKNHIKIPSLDLSKTIKSVKSTSLTRQKESLSQNRKKVESRFNQIQCTQRPHAKSCIFQVEGERDQLLSSRTELSSYINNQNSIKKETLANSQYESENTHLLLQEIQKKNRIIEYYEQMLMEQTDKHQLSTDNKVKKYQQNIQNLILLYQLEAGKTQDYQQILEMAGKERMSFNPAMSSAKRISLDSKSLLLSSVVSSTPEGDQFNQKFSFGPSSQSRDLFSSLSPKKDGANIVNCEGTNLFLERT